MEDFFGLDSIEKNSDDENIDGEIINMAFCDEEMNKLRESVLNMAQSQSQSEAISSFLSSTNDDDPVPVICSEPAPAPVIQKVIQKKESRGTLKRKVVGTIKPHVPTKLSLIVKEYSSNENDERRNKRYKKKVCTPGTFLLGTTSYAMIPSSAQRRLCQVICAVGSWNLYSIYFNKITDKFNSLRELCDRDMVENGIETKKGYYTCLRATIQRALCTQGKGEDGMFVEIARYILQEKFVDSNSMNYDKIQSLLGAICKQNKKINTEFSILNYSKIGPSRVALGVFNIFQYKKN